MEERAWRGEMQLMDYFFPKIIFNQRPFSMQRSVLLQASRAVRAGSIIHSTPNFSTRVIAPQCFRMDCTPAASPQVRWLVTSNGMDPNLRKRMDHLAHLFVEARDEIEMADESKGTTYFNAEAEEAITAVEAALAEYNSILTSLKDPERGEFQRGNGLKMEQLKGEVDSLLAEDDH
jgi:hypothetical protein